MAKTKRKVKKTGKQIKSDNAKSLDTLRRIRESVYMASPRFEWSPTNCDNVGFFVTRVREGCLKCTTNAYSNLIGLQLTEKQMQDATSMLKVKLLNHHKVRANEEFTVREYAPALFVKTKAVCLEAVNMYLGKFLFPRIEFRRVWGELSYPLATKLRVHKNKGYLPMYIMSVFMEDPADRKNWFNKASAKREGVEPLGQMHMVAIDLRPGRAVVLDDCLKTPVPYSNATFAAACRFGVMACYQVVPIDYADVMTYKAWESMNTNDT